MTRLKKRPHTHCFSSYTIQQHTSTLSNTIFGNFLTNGKMEKVCKKYGKIMGLRRGHWAGLRLEHWVVLARHYTDYVTTLIWISKNHTVKCGDGIAQSVEQLP